jgi:hypothetical protein
MVVMQLSTDEGSFICNVKESDLPKIDAGEAGTRIVMHCAIRLDAMLEGQYELHKTKVIDTSSIDFYQSLQQEARRTARKGRPALVRDKGERDG